MTGLKIKHHPFPGPQDHREKTTSRMHDAQWPVSTVAWPVCWWVA